MTPDEVDAIPYYDEYGRVIDHKNIERDEQTLARKHIRPDHKVLELGSRYGTVSCMINSLLSDPTQHVAVDPAVEVLPALMRNRESHGAQFHVVTGVISRVPMQVCQTPDFNQYATFTLPTATPNTTSFTLEEIQEKYNIKFNCLVADCEGFLEQFFKENPKILEQLDTVMFEADLWQRCDYGFVRGVLELSGFKVTDQLAGGFQSVWVR